MNSLPDMKSFITKFSDLTHQEFSKKYLNLNYDTLALANFEPTYVTVTNAAPSNYDWRNQGRVLVLKIKLHMVNAGQSLQFLT